MKERPRIWLPEAPFLSLRRCGEMVLPETKTGLSGHFTVELVHARTGLVRRRLAFPNMITNAGLALLMSNNGQLGNNMLIYLAVGTSSAAVSADQTALGAEVTRTNNSSGFPDTNGTVGTGADIEYHWRKRVRVFTESQGNGNLTELGFFNTSSSGTMWNRQLFLDELGQPTTITKTNEDQLRITYELRTYMPASQVSEMDVLVRGTPVLTTVTTAPFALQNYWRDAWTTVFFSTATDLWADRSNGQWARDHLLPTLPGGYSQGASVVAGQAPGAPYRDVTATWGPAGAVWPEGVGAVFGRYNPIFRSTFDPRIPKTDTDRLVIGARFTAARQEDLG